MSKNLEIQGAMSYGKVISGCYEDCLGLMNHQLYFGLRMDSVVMPEEDYVIKNLYGTLDQVCDLMAHIDKDIVWREYYASSLDALERYQNGDEWAMHYVGGEAESFLTPVMEVGRSAYMIEDAEWLYRDKCGSYIRAKADTVGIHQVLLWDGNKYVRCARYGFEGLSRAHTDKGWIPYDGTSCGVPCMIDSHGNGDAYNRLFVVEDTYKDLETAMRNMQREDNFKYEQVSRELFSGC